MSLHISLILLDPAVSGKVWIEVLEGIGEVVGRKEENKELGTNDYKKKKKTCQHFTRLNLVSTNNTNLAPSLSHIL